LRGVTISEKQAAQFFSLPFSLFPLALSRLKFFFFFLFAVAVVLLSVGLRPK
jgi:hypothetical protein